MSKKVQKEVVYKRDVRLHGYLRGISYYYGDDEGAPHQFSEILIAMLFCSFTVEAFVNFIGYRVVDDWNGVEKNFDDLKSKVKFISKELGLDVDFGKRPFQTLHEMKAFRDYIVHGKYQPINESFTELLLEHEKPTKPLLEWENMINEVSLKKFMGDVDQLAQIIFDAAKERVPGIDWGISWQNYGMSEWEANIKYLDE